MSMKPEKMVEELATALGTEIPPDVTDAEGRWMVLLGTATAMAHPLNLSEVAPNLVKPQPPHLREDTPYLARCSQCGRKTWSAGEISRRCGAPRPDGPQCGGILEANASARDLM